MTRDNFRDILAVSAIVVALLLLYTLYITKIVTVEPNYESMMRSTVKVQIMRTVDQEPAPAHGSGVIVEGGILTAAHVVRYVEQGKDMKENPLWIRIEFYDGEYVKAKIEDYSFVEEGEKNQIKVSDLAFLDVDIPPKYKASSVKPNCGELGVGDKVWAVGNPGPMTWVVTEGKVSSKRKRPDYPEGAWLQTDMTIAPGNSGGPVFDKYGKLVGIVSHISIAGPHGMTGHGFHMSGREICEFLYN